MSWSDYPILGVDIGKRFSHRLLIIKPAQTTIHPNTKFKGLR